MAHKDPDKKRKYDREYRKANERNRREYNRRWIAANPGKKQKYSERGREFSWLKKYGLTPDMVARIYLAQEGLCAICLNPFADKVSKRCVFGFVIDHCHKTGFVRGLLHDDCNVSKFGDDPTLLRAAADYFELHSK